MPHGFTTPLLHGCLMCCCMDVHMQHVVTHLAESGSFSHSPGCDSAAQLITASTVPSANSSGSPPPVARSTCARRRQGAFKHARACRCSHTDTKTCVQGEELRGTSLDLLHVAHLASHHHVGHGADYGGAVCKDHLQSGHHCSDQVPSAEVGDGRVNSTRRSSSGLKLCSAARHTYRPQGPTS